MNKFTILDILLDLMESVGETFSASVTVFANGAVISCDLIHPMAYYKGVALLLETQPDKPDSTNAAKILGKSLREDIEKEEESPSRSREEDSKKEPDVIYLKDIALWNTSRRVPVGKSFLALSIDAIDGFILGKLPP